MGKQKHDAGYRKRLLREQAAQEREERETARLAAQRERKAAELLMVDRTQEDGR